MSQYSSDFGQPAEMAPVLSLANAMLISLTLTVITLACGLATFVTNTHVVDRLQEAGYVAWSGSSVWADIRIPSPNVSPGSSVWYRIQPGGRLDFAFTTLPKLRAAATAASFFIGGMLALSAFASLAKLRTNKSLGILPGLFVCMVGVGACFPSAPEGICIDLSQNTITSGLQPGAPVMSFSPSDGFTVRTHYGIHTSSIHVDAFDANGQPFDVLTLRSTSETYDLVNALNNFINSQGVQI